MRKACSVLMRVLHALFDTVCGIALLVILCIAVSAMVFFSKRDKAPEGEYYIQYVQGKLGFPFAIDTIELVNAVGAFEDQTLDIKACVSMDEAVSPAELIGMGWNCSKLPEEFESERLLERQYQFDSEMLSCNEQCDCLWLYIDEYLAFYGKKARYGGFAACVYRSPNYIIALYEPQSGQLFFRESDS